MKTEVLLERLSDNRFRATGLGRFALSVEGDTRDLALTNFQKAASALVPVSGEVVDVEIPLPVADIPPSDPWAWFAGSVSLDDPLYQMYLEQIQINRQLDNERERQKLAQEEAQAAA